MSRLFFSVAISKQLNAVPYLRGVHNFAYPYREEPCQPCAQPASQLVTHQRQIKSLVNFDLLGHDLFEVVPCGQEGQCVTWHFSGEYSSFLDVEHINDTIAVVIS